MPLASFATLWTHHPGSGSMPCSSDFMNQCAIRMSVALDGAKIDTRGFDKMFPGRRCWYGHSPGHILAAQELADWISTETQYFGLRKEYTDGDDVRKLQGIVFIQNGWGTTDHIDLWDGSIGEMRGGSSGYLSRGRVWFWEL